MEVSPKLSGYFWVRQEWVKTRFKKKRKKLNLKDDVSLIFSILMISFPERMLSISYFVINITYFVLFFAIL